MNKVILMGRLTADPDVRKAGDSLMARYTLAVNRKSKDEIADFINCVAWGRLAELAQKYLIKGSRLLVVGHIQTGSYKNKDGVTIYTTDVYVEEQEFADDKKSRGSNSSSNQNDEGYMKNY